MTFGEDYVYPKWAEIMGLCISFSSMIWVPIYAIYYLITSKGSLKERWVQGITPIFDQKAQKALKNQEFAAEEILLSNEAEETRNLA